MPTRKKKSMYVTFEFICQKEKRGKKKCHITGEKKKAYWFNSTSYKLNIFYEKGDMLWGEKSEFIIQINLN